MDILEEKIKTSLNNIKVSERKQDRVFENIIKNAEDENYVTNKKFKSVKLFMDRYVGYAAVAVICICVFGVYSVQSNLFGVESQPANIARSIDINVFTAYEIDGENMVQKLVDVSELDPFSIWKDLTSQNIYPENIKLNSVDFNENTVKMYFSKEILENEEILYKAVASSFKEFYSECESLEIYANGELIYLV